MPSVGAVLVQYCPSMESKCWLEADLGIHAERWRGTGVVLPQYGVKCWLEADLGIYAERWRGTGVVLPQYGVKCWLEADLGIYAERWCGTGSVLPQYGVQTLARSRLRDLCRALARYWFSTAPVWCPNAG